MIVFKILNKIERILDRIYTFFIKKNFKNFGKNSLISFKCKFNYPKNISIGSNVTICKDVWLNAGVESREDNLPTLIIGDGCYISSYSHINAFKEVIIEKDVLIGESVYLGDTIHSTDDYDIPIIKQKYVFKGKVVVGTGSHICRNSTISAECEIGRNCLISPNTFVVHKKIPDHTLAIGNPSTLIEDYNKKK